MVAVISGEAEKPSTGQPKASASIIEAWFQKQEINL